MARGRWWSEVQQMQLLRSHALAGGGSLLETPWNLVFRPELGYAPAFSAALMAAFLLSALLAARAPGAGTLRAAAWLGVVAWAATPTRSGRYLMTVVPLMTLSAGVALEVLHRRWPHAWRGVLAAIFAVAILQAHRPVAPWFVWSDAAYARELARNRLFGLSQRLNRELPPEARLWLAFENRAFFLERPHVYCTSWEAPQIITLLREAGGPAQAAARLRAEGFTHLLVNWGPADAYLEQRLPFQLTDPVLLPPEQFAREREHFHQLLERHARSVLVEGQLTVYALGGA